MAREVGMGMNAPALGASIENKIYSKMSFLSERVDVTKDWWRWQIDAAQPLKRGA